MNEGADHQDGAPPQPPLVPGQDLSAGSSNDRQMNHRKRLRVSCGECRKKKLSCDRRLPCHRCIRSGRPDQCSFEAGTRPVPAVDSLSIQHQTQHHDGQIRELQAAVAQLKVMVSKVADERSLAVGKLQGLNEIGDSDQAAIPIQEEVIRRQIYVTCAQGSENELLHRSPRGYYQQHTLFKFFVEIPELFPFIRETADEWFKPRGVSLSKTKLMWHERRSDAPSGEASLEDLLPPKSDTDALVSFYLDHVEHLHRVIHVPTFKREYAHFWEPQRVRFPAMTVFILAMISISACVSSRNWGSCYVDSASRKMPLKWISACDDWLRQQASKARKLVYYQVGCLIYIGKRINNIRKKRYWNETGSMIQNAILDGLHCELASDSPYLREIKRRVWAVLREMDLQNTFEFELPTLLHTLEPTVGAPANIEDENFDESSKYIPQPSPPSQYTCTSFQFLSSRSWALRLEISRLMFSSGASKALSYEQVLRYTQELSQAIDSLPSWNEKDHSAESAKMPMLVSALLQFQLKECILTIHRPYLEKGGARFSLSERICNCTSRDILLSNRRLAELGIQSLAPLREDLLVAAMSLTRIDLLQRKGGSNISVMPDSESTVDLLEKCLPLVEDRYMRCLLGEPWGPLTLCGCIMLLKIHLGKETRQTAKATCAQRFLGLYYNHFARQDVTFPRQSSSLSRDYESQPIMGGSSRQLSTPATTAFSGSTWLDSGYSDLSLDSHDLDMNWDDAWESLWPTLASQPVHFE